MAMAMPAATPTGARLHKLHFQGFAMRLPLIFRELIDARV
jgi:hypothetical protein